MIQILIQLINLYKTGKTNTYNSASQNGPQLLKGAPPNFVNGAVLT